MGTIGPSIYVPRPMNRLLVRNGQPVRATNGRLIGEALNHLLAHQRKMFASYSINLSTLPTTQANGCKIWRTYLQPGEMVDDLRLLAITGIAPAGNSAATLPRVYWQLTEVGGATTDGSVHQYGPYQASWGMDDIRIVWSTIQFDSTGAHYCHLQVEDYAQPVFAILCEQHPGIFTDTETYVASIGEMAVGAPIYDTHATDLRHNGHTLWKHNGAPFFAWACDQDPDVAGASSVPRTSSASAENALDTSRTAFAASAPGWKLQARYHQPAHSNNVACTFAAFAEDVSAGSGEVQLRDANGTLVTLTGFSAAGSWVTGTCNLLGNQDNHEVQVFIKGTGTQEIRLTACSLYPYVT